MPDPTLAQFGDQKYIALETFEKNGQGVKTPVWFVLHNDALYVYTEADSWKVKRIRNTPRVTLAICDMRGNAKSEAVEATAAILDKSNNGAVYDAIGKRYGLVGKTFNLFSKLRGGMTKNVGLELRAAA